MKREEERESFEENICHYRIIMIIISHMQSL